MDFSKFLPAAKKAFSGMATKAEQVGAREADDILQGELSSTLRQGAKLGDDAIDAEFRTAGAEMPSATQEPLSINIPGITPEAETMLPSFGKAATGLGLAGAGLGAAYMMGNDSPLAVAPTTDSIPEPHTEPASLPPQDPNKGSAIARLQGMLSRRGPSNHTMDFGDVQSNNTVAGLKEAEGKRDSVELANNLGRAGELVGSSIARAKPIAQDLLKEQAASGESFVKDFHDQGNQEKDDPNSGISAAYRKAMERFGVKVKGTPSANTIEKIAPWIVKAYEGEEARNARHDDLAFKTALVKDAKHEAAIDKHVTAMKDSLDPNKARGGNMATNQKKVDQADRLISLSVNPETGKVDNLDRRNIEELAIGLNSMLAAGVGSAEQVKNLIPVNYRGEAAKLQEWLSKNPQGTDQIAFVSKMLGSVVREKDVASDQVKRAQIQRLSAENWLKTNAPEEYYRVLNGYQIDPSEIDAKGQYKSKRKAVDMDKLKADMDRIAGRPANSEVKTTANQALTVVKRGYNPKTNQTQFIYSDGSKKIVDGKQ
jgi:hypothetical protein